MSNYFELDAAFEQIIAFYYYMMQKDSENLDEYLEELTEIRAAQNALTSNSHLWTQEALEKLQSLAGRNNQTWVKVHGSGYNVPAEIIDLVKAGVLSDASSDRCTSPRFLLPDTDCMIWVEHPDSKKRKAPGQRFVVTRVDEELHDVEELLITDDLKEALELLVK